MADLDRCQLSMRNSVFIIEATIKELEYNTDDYPLSKSIKIVIFKRSIGYFNCSLEWQTLTSFQCSKT